MGRISNQVLYHRNCVNMYEKYMLEKGYEPLVGEFKEYLIDNNTLPPNGVDKDYINATTISKVRSDAFDKNPQLEDLASITNADFENESYKQSVEDMISKTNKFVVTTYVSDKTVSRDFWEAVLNYCKRNNAQPIVIPSYDVKGTRRKVGWRMDSYIAKTAFVITHDTHLAPNLLISGIEVTAKQKNPQCALKSIHTHTNCHVISGGTVQQLSHTAREQDKYPWVKMTPGACSVPDYNEDYTMSKASSYNAEKRHLIGAVIVELGKDDVFFYRQVQAGADGSFTDLGKVYHPNGEVTDVAQSLFVMGDIHAGQHNLKLFKDVKKFLMNHDHIKNVVLHDLCDGESVNPHESNKCLDKSLKYNGERLTYKYDVNCACGVVNELTELRNDLGVIIVPSNHDDFLDRSMNDPGNFTPNPNWKDAIKYCSYRIDIAEANEKRPEDDQIIPMNAFEYLATKRYNLVKDLDRVMWLKINNTYQMYGVGIGHHGHKGPNGAKGSLSSYANMEQHEVIGHSHTAGIMGGTYQVGTFSKLQQGYNIGPSSWTHTGCLVYPGAQKQLITFVRVGEEYKYTIDE